MSKKKRYLNRKQIHKRHPPISAVAMLCGILKDVVPADMDWKEIKIEYLKAKYGL